MDEETLQKTEKIAYEILRMAKNKLLVNLRFLDVALSRLEPVSAPDKTTS